MDQFSDLFDRPIPREDAEAFLPMLRKIAKGDHENGMSRTKARRVLGGAAAGAAGGAGASAVLHQLEKRYGKNAPATLSRGSLARGVARGAMTGVGAGALMHVLKNKKKTASYEEKLAAIQAVADALGAEPTPEQVMLQEQQGELQQALAENAHLHEELEAAQGLVQEHAQGAEEAGQQVQMMQEEQQQAAMQQQEADMAAQQAQQDAAMQLEQAQQQLMEAQMQTQQAQQEAQTQATQAASQADGKMRLAIRIQQIRQQLSEMAAQDPVAEEGEQADAIQTPGQMGAPPADPAAAAAMGGDPAAGGAPPGVDPAAAAAAPEGGPALGPEGAAAAPSGGAKPKPKTKTKDKKDDKDKSTNKTEIKIGSVMDRALALLREDHEKRAGLGSALKRPFQRAGELITGSRATRLRGAAQKTREKAVGVAAGLRDVARPGSLHEKSEPLLQKAQKLEKAHARERMAHHATVTGLAAGSTGLGYTAGRRRWDAHRDAQEEMSLAQSARQKKRALERRKTAEFELSKLADAARMARIRELLAEGKGLKPLIGKVTPKAKAVAKPVAKPSNSTAISKHAPYHAHDRVFEAGAKIPQNAGPPKGNAKAYRRWRNAAQEQGKVDDLKHDLSAFKGIAGGGIGLGVVGGEAAHQHRLVKEERRKAAAMNVADVKGYRSLAGAGGKLKRFGELLTGGRANKLEEAAQRTFQRAHNVPHGKIIPKKKAVAFEAGRKHLADTDKHLEVIRKNQPDVAKKIEDAIAPTRKTFSGKGVADIHNKRRDRVSKGLFERGHRLNSAAAAERKAVSKTRRNTALGAGGVTAAGGVGWEANRRRKQRQADPFEKQATEAQVRSDAHRAAGRASVLPGALLGYGASRLAGHTQLGRAGGAALGGGLGYMQGRAGFSKRELANDFHMERALTKARRDRAEKAFEKGAGAMGLGKSASYELADVDIDALYGLVGVP